MRVRKRRSSIFETKIKVRNKTITEGADLSRQGFLSRGITTSFLKEPSPVLDMLGLNLPLPFS